jgi:DNA processing protein
VSAFDLSPAAARAALRGITTQHEHDDAVVERYAAVVWCHLVEPGDSAAGAVIAQLGAAAGLRAVIADGPVPSIDDRTLAEARRRWMPRLDAEHIADGLRRARKAQVGLITPADPEWPEQLDDLGLHSPLCLWVRGERTTLPRVDRSVAVVGARAATRYGEHVALELAADLGGGGVPIISGGAYGIDGAAHNATMLAGGLTVALLAGGVDRAYPAGNTALLERVAATGAVLSEVPCGSAPTKWRFLQRNRLIAALSAGTVVVEAGWRSGSLNTAGHAAALSRRLGAVPGPITSAASAGTHRLIREYGAQCITSAADVREMLGFDGSAPRPGDGRPMTDDTTRVRDALSTRVWRSGADVARRAGMTHEEVEPILGLLDLEGAVVRSADGWRLRSS